VKFEDKLEPTPQGKLRRTLKLSDNTIPRSIALLSGKIDRDGAQAWRKGKLTLKILQPSSIKASIVGQTLQAEIESTIVIEVSW
jgi:hypothetical protein